MAKLYFRYGAMGSSKSANAIMARFNYLERGQSALMVKPRMETRDGDHIIKSRIGLQAPCSYMDELIKTDRNAIAGYDCIIVDEAQFLTRDEVLFLTGIVDELDIPVMCYGLRTDFQGNLFPGSDALMAYADKIEEVKTMCWCGRKATFNARLQDGHVVKEGEQIVLGANERYIALCRKHWKSGQLNEEDDV